MKKLYAVITENKSITTLDLSIWEKIEVQNLSENF